MSKFLAGLAIGEAERQGILDRERSMASYSNEFPGSILEDWANKKFKKDEEDYPEDITLRRLLSHTAGLDTHGIGIQAPGFVKTMEGIILGNILDPFNNGVQPIHVPGSVYDYSGGGYTVAEHVLELTTGETYTDWVTENILEVVGTDDSTLETAHDGMTNLARGCSRGICVGSVMRTNVKAAGGFIATAYDYAKIIRAVINDGFDDTGTRVIKKKVIKKVMTAEYHKDSVLNSCSSTDECAQTKQYRLPGISCFDLPYEQICYLNQCKQLIEDSSGWRYGQGVSMAGSLMEDGYHTIIEHGGSQEGYKTKFYADREKKIGIVILVAGDEWSKNGEDRGANAIKNEIYQAFKRAYLQE